MPTNGAGKSNTGYSPSSLIKHGETACASFRPFLRFLFQAVVDSFVRFFFTVKSSSQRSILCPKPVALNRFMS